jgi:hypothetical protein
MSTTRRVVRRKECNVITAEQFNALAVGPDDATRTLHLTGAGERARVLVAVTGPGLGFSTDAG